MVPNSIIHIRVDVTYRKPRALGFHCGHTLRNPRPRGAVWEPTEGNVPGLPRRPPSSGRAMRTDCARAPDRCRQDEAVLGEPPQPVVASAATRSYLTLSWSLRRFHLRHSTATLLVRSEEHTSELQS